MLPADAGALASALDELRRDDSRYLDSARCAPKVAAEYDVRTVCDRLLAVYGGGYCSWRVPAATLPSPGMGCELARNPPHESGQLTS